jgi:hypothetical protein
MTENRHGSTMPQILSRIATLNQKGRDPRILQAKERAIDDFGSRNRKP